MFLNFKDIEDMVNSHYLWVVGLWAILGDFFCLILFFKYSTVNIYFCKDKVLKL